MDSAGLQKNYENVFKQISTFKLWIVNSKRYSCVVFYSLYGIILT